MMTSFIGIILQIFTSIALPLQASNACSGRLNKQHDMQNKLNVKQISVADVKAAEICRIMDEAGIDFVEVAHHDWAEAYPYRPQMEVRMAHNGNQLLINYRVSEECVAARSPHDDGNVWEDSCCELFISPVADGTYYNIECNAAGQLLVGFGPERHNRERAPQQITAQIDRWTTMGRTPFEARMGQQTWQLCLAIPTTVFYQHKVQSLNGLDAKANVYKCGDCLPHPHFLSFYPIDLPKPDFHRPDFFGDIHFE